MNKCEHVWQLESKSNGLSKYHCKKCFFFGLFDPIIYRIILIYDQSGRRVWTNHIVIDSIAEWYKVFGLDNPAFEEEWK